MGACMSKRTDEIKKSVLVFPSGHKIEGVGAGYIGGDESVIDGLSGYCFIGGGINPANELCGKFENLLCSYFPDIPPDKIRWRTQTVNHKDSKAFPFTRLKRPQILILFEEIADLIGSSQTRRTAVVSENTAIRKGLETIDIEYNPMIPIGYSFLWALGEWIKGIRSKSFILGIIVEENPTISKIESNRRCKVHEYLRELTSYAPKIFSELFPDIDAEMDINIVPKNWHRITQLADFIIYWCNRYFSRNLKTRKQAINLLDKIKLQSLMTNKASLKQGFIPGGIHPQDVNMTCIAQYHKLTHL